MNSERHYNLSQNHVITIISYNPNPYIGLGLLHSRRINQTFPN
jgi:hypothetical protein